MSPIKPADPAPAVTVAATEAATATTTTTNTADKENKQQNKGPPSAVEFEPPLACVRRILKHTLPSSTNVGKDASAAFARASGIFIIYLTACANDFARENRRQTITANDVLAAIKELEFDEFTPELTSFLEKYRNAEKSKKVAKAKAAAAAAEEGDDNDDEEDGDEDKTSTPQSSLKRKDPPDGADVSMDQGDGEDDGDHTDEEPEAQEDDTQEPGEVDDGDDDEEEDVEEMEE